MRKAALLIVAVATQFFGISLHAYELRHSAKTDSWDNPFIAYGYNPRTHITTGYLAALRTAPGRTDECKLAFAGDLNKIKSLSVIYAAEAMSSGSSGPPRKRVALVNEQGVSYLKFSKKDMGGDCDWVLPFVIESTVPDNSDEVVVQLNAQNAGEWISVYVIKAKKAKFHSRPESSAVQEAFLIEGNVIYVYEEQQDWYFVKYDQGKRKTEGWIRKSDTLQP